MGYYDYHCKRRTHYSVFQISARISVFQMDAFVTVGARGFMQGEMQGIVFFVRMSKRGKSGLHRQCFILAVHSTAH